MSRSNTDASKDSPSDTILMREIQMDDGIGRAPSRQPTSQELSIYDKATMSNLKTEELFGDDSKEQTLSGEYSGSVKVDGGGSNGLKKWVERRWVWAIYGVMFLAGEFCKSLELMRPAMVIVTDNQLI
jgi:hypothetical protein